ncbi:hypothetical protein GCK32_012405 [Trichostrongylus colubriformis]|uniref:PABS domain-containing protein n=1 Tax=Trichostrongylus colubriformis TaxID=6319 RepID=A0AAN8FEX3_TRICO
MRWSCRRPLRRLLNFIRNKQSYNLRCLSVISLLVCVLVYIVVYIFLLDSTVIDTQYVNAVDQSVLNNRVDFHEMAILKLCSNRTSRCYSVYDRKSTLNGEEVVERHLLVDGFSDESDTVVRLVAPNGETFDTSDTRIWAIDHSAIRSDYVNITVVELDPVVVEIARSWFGVMESKNHHVVVNDGLKFIEEAGKSGSKFDVVVLDACDEAIRSPCPGAAFRNVKVIEMMKSVLTSTGVLEITGTMLFIPLMGTEEY